MRLVTAHGRDKIAVDLAARGWNSFERPLPEFIAAGARLVNGAFFDVGAHTGLYSLLAACASLHTEVHAFEPYSPALKILRKNISVNRLADRITVCDSAVGDRCGGQSMYIPSQAHGLLESSASLNADFKGEHSGVTDIDVITLDAYTESLESTAAGLLKIDVESTEHKVLAGGTETIARDRPLLVLEVLHLANHAWLDTFCRKNRYRIFTLHPEYMQARTRVEFHGDAWNQCFCPEEKLSILQSCADRIGLEFRH